MKLISQFFRNHRSRAGFSLIEMQVVVAVVALLAAIAVPQVPRITAQASAAKARVNAQNLASMVNAANAAGIEFKSLETALAEATRPDGMLSAIGIRCGVTSLSSTELNAAKQYLQFENGLVVYLPN